jgi:hypothetical protein
MLTSETKRVIIKTVKESKHNQKEEKEMMYKQVIIDNYEVYDVELDVIMDRTRVLDIDTEEIENIEGYTLEDRFENMFSPELFREGSNHTIKVQLFNLDDDECTDDPVCEHSFRCPYQD